MSKDVLPAELMKEAKTIHYCEDCCKEISPDDYPYHSADHTTIPKEWLPVSAVTQWRPKLAAELKESFIGNFKFKDKNGNFTTQYEKAEKLTITVWMFEEIIKNVNQSQI